MLDQLEVRLTSRSVAVFLRSHVSLSRDEVGLWALAALLARFCSQAACSSCWQLEKAKLHSTSVSVNYTMSMKCGPKMTTFFSQRVEGWTGFASFPFAGIQCQLD